MIYIRKQINKKYVCPKPLNYVTSTKCAFDNGDEFVSTPISKLYIKTAYNCCCKGKFKNDYVDIQKGTSEDFCALRNCAMNGVRALDFTVYSKNKKPVISASTKDEINYKELYNNVDFDLTMKQVYRFFLFERNSSLTKDPLFLIFRIQSDIPELYDSVATSLTQNFGVGSQYGNMIYMKKLNNMTTLNEIKNTRVVIMVQPYDLEKLEKSSLNNVTAYKLNADGYTRPCINRFSDKLTNLDTTEINIIYPDLYNKQSKNFDPTKYFIENITFIGMNFQTNDNNLKKYNAKFKDSSLILQQTKK
jgi:hypothetical protein